MCELFGFTAAAPRDIAPALRVFYPHSKDHPDGWGLAVMRDTNINIEKEPTPAFESTYLAHRLSVPVTEKLVLAHIRKASVGSICYVNAHPFIRQDRFGKRWVLTHNGSLFEEPGLAEYAALQEGSTDSERLLVRFVEQVDRCDTEPGIHECAGFLENIADQLTICNNKINTMLSDGTYLYVYANHSDKLWMKQEDGAITFSTLPLSEDGWEKVPQFCVMVCKDGRVLHTGQPHGNPFIPPVKPEEQK